MATGIKRPTLKGPLYGYLGHFSKAKHVREGHNTNVDEILSRPPRSRAAAATADVPAIPARARAAMTSAASSTPRRSTPTPAASSNSSLSLEDVPKIFRSSHTPPKGKQDVPTQQAVDFFKSIEDDMKRFRKVQERTARLGNRSPSGGGRF